MAPVGVGAYLGASPPSARRACPRTIASGSWLSLSTKVLLHDIGIARKVKARVAVVTAARTSPAARRADTVLAIDDRPGRATKGRSARRQPLGSLFEQAFLVVCDHIILDLMDALHLGERDLEGHHTTFE